MGDDKPEQIIFHYEKINDFKTYLATGVFGGVSLAGLINMDFFVDRVVIPQKATHDVLHVDNGMKLINERKEGKDGMVREVQVGILMDRETAISMIKWLQEKVDAIDEISK